ncbi:hypothetical protein [Klebsiella phage pKV-BS375-3.1]|nr:hypothetical protein [Klebsiella phage pKV-BS375-3.1]
MQYVLTGITCQPLFDALCDTCHYPGMSNVLDKPRYTYQLHYGMHYRMHQGSHRQAKLWCPSHLPHLLVRLQY